MPKLSIVTPVFNTDVGLLEAYLKSIQAQTFADFELLCTDDGSPQTAQRTLIERYAYADSRIRLDVFAQNRGVSAARNNGLARACGEYVLFADPDDLLAPDFFATLMRAADDYAVDLLGYELQPFADAPPQSARGSRRVRRFLMGHVFTCTTLYRRCRMASVMFDENLRLGEDIPYTLRAYALCPRRFHIDYFGYFYRKNAQSVSRRCWSAQGIERNLILCQAMLNDAHLLPDHEKKRWHYILLTRLLKAISAVRSLDGVEREHTLELAHNFILNNGVALRKITPFYMPPLTFYFRKPSSLLARHRIVLMRFLTLFIPLRMKLRHAVLQFLSVKKAVHEDH